MRRLVAIAAIFMASCTPTGGGGGGGGDAGGGDAGGDAAAGPLMWMDCREVSFEAPCCPVVDVESLCRGDEMFVQYVDDDLYVEGCHGDRGPSVEVGGTETYVVFVAARQPDRLPWEGSVVCGDNGRVRFHRHFRDDPYEDCIGACFLPDDGCSDFPHQDPCPENDPFPLPSMDGAGER